MEMWLDFIKLVGLVSELVIISKLANDRWGFETRSIQIFEFRQIDIFDTLGRAGPVERAAIDQT
jgi:hypothetical protein